MPVVKMERGGKEFGPEDGSGPLRRRVSIGTLPDEALLEIFCFYLQSTWDEDAWITLAHVCQRWRCVVMASPRHLNLRLICTGHRPVREILGVWSNLPIAIHWEKYDGRSWRLGDVDNVAASLKHNDRIYEIKFEFMPSPLLERYVGLMQVPFPALTSLELFSSYVEASDIPAALPDSFLGGSAPRLRSLKLNGVPFPALPNLLSTTTDLVKLTLYRTPHSGYLPPEEMVTCLSILVRLETLELGFLSPQSCPDRTLARRRPHPLTRTVLPALKSLYFTGVGEYLEELVTRLDAPLLNDIHTTFFDQLTFDTPYIRQFLHRAGQFESPKQAKVIFDKYHVEVILSPPMSVIDNGEDGLSMKISCHGLDRQLSSVAQICNSYLPPLSTLDHLCINHWLPSPELIEINVEHARWVELFHPFAAVKNLYLTEKMDSLVLPTLQQLVGESVTEVLPALQNIFLAGAQQTGPVQEAIQSFTSTRQVFGRPVAIHSWKGDWWNLKDYDV